MSFAYRAGTLCAEGVALDDIARRFGTPCYVYSRAAIESAYQDFAHALGSREGLICYSVKANSNLAILALLARLGAGFDIVSGGELKRLLAAGADVRKTLFSGVGKSEAEIAAALQAGIYCLNLESEAELARVSAVAERLRLRAPIAFRVNPDIDAKTHRYISTGLRQDKFGVAHANAERLYASAAASPHIEVRGIGCHIGSQITATAPFVAAAERIARLADRLAAAGIRLQHIDLGGGMGIRYKDEAPPAPGEFVAAALEALGSRGERLIFDPGRSLVGNAGVLLTRVEYVKPGFVVIDAAMNDLLRPALYGAWHEVKPIKEANGAEALCDIVGPVCESGDFLAKERRIAAQQGGLLALMSAGAYAMSMSSNYNSRPRAAEVLVSGTQAELVRRRESAEELFALERIPG